MSRSRQRSLRWLPLLVLAIGVVASLAAFAVWRTVVDRESEATFRDAADDSARAVRVELSRSEDALRGLRGLFVASDAVRRDEFRRYVGALELQDAYPSLRGLTYISSLAPGDVERFVAEQRADGEPFFTVRAAPSALPPAPPAPDRRIITFIEPGETSTARLGFDLSRRADSRGAQDRSRDTGGATLTGRVTLIGDHAAGFGIFLPIYEGGAPVASVADRRAALRGWLVARFRGPNFMAGIRDRVPRRVRVELFDGDRADPAALLGATGGGRATGDAPQRTVRIARDGHVWTVRVTALHGFANAGHGREPLGVLVFGLLLSGLLAALVGSQVNARRRADHEVELRTAELRATAAQLRRANADLEAHNHEVETFARLQRDFVTTTSHELRTPLTTVLGYLEIVLGAPDEELSQAQRGHLQVVWRSAQRLLSLVGDLLTVDRAESGVMEIEPEPVALGPVIAPAMHDLELACVANGLTLAVGPIPSDLVVVADPDRFRQVLDNLIGNAIKFTPAPGEISIAVEAVGERAEIRISDTGPGIPEDEIEHIFQRFYRTSSTAETAAQGTGLGLSIARALVEAHGGTLTAESVVGEGATFTVSVPLAPVAVSAVAP